MDIGGVMGGLAGSARSADSNDIEQVRKAARGLEAALIRQMLSAMEKAQLESGFFGSGAGAGPRQTTFQLMLSEALSETEPLGLAEQLAEQLTGQSTGQSAGQSAGGPSRPVDPAKSGPAAGNRGQVEMGSGVALDPQTFLYFRDEDSRF